MNQQREQISKAGRQLSNNSDAGAQLVASQLQTKKELKTKLKFQRRVHKLETRIAHAISRKDPVVEHQARKDLDDLLRTRNDSLILNTCCMSRITDSSTTSVDARRSAAVEEVTQIFRQLLTSLDQKSKESVQDGSLKQIQNSKARNLLRHMTKGTQDIDMFQDVEALRGYVRKKFHGRALIVNSLGNITPESMQMAPGIDGVNEEYRLQYQKQRELIDMCYDMLLSIQHVCSIGCGPGNDAVGLIAFLRSRLSNESKGYETGRKLSEVMLLDFAIEEWKEAALNDLVHILQPQYVRKIICQSCDVTKPIITNHDDKESAESKDEVNNPCIAEFVQRADIFLTSYLLSETHHKWDLFFVQLVELAPVGALFYFSEPMAWQLHRLIRMSTPSSSDDTAAVDLEKESQVEDLTPLQSLNFVWIDSSMHYPEMQQMEGRAGGPAVLLAIKL
jgi:hypothetical protein